MSYDVFLFRLPEDGDAASALEELMSREEQEPLPIPEPVRSAMQLLADELKWRRPSLVQFQPARRLTVFQIRLIRPRPFKSLSQAVSILGLPARLHRGPWSSGSLHLLH